MPHIFGTDGVRGLANVEPLSPEMVMALGRAAVGVLPPSSTVGKKPCFVVGRDPRVSSSMLEAALTAGICSAGGDVLPVGVIPSGGVSYLTRCYNATAGAMISASHNPYMDNGVKFFSATGAKLTDELENALETHIASGEAGQRPTGAAVGRVLCVAQPLERYVDFLVSCFPQTSSRPCRIGLDCAHGAASSVALQLFERVGITVRAWNITPDGLNINQDCGAVHPEFLQDKVLAEGLEAGFAFDGDADRLIAVDHLGNVLDGDHILAICARHLKAYDTCDRRVVVGTVMSNLGLDRALQQMGFTLYQAQVGDKHVLQAMLQHGAWLGGEPSGHVIFLRHHCTGDGLLTALQLLHIMGETRLPLTELAQVMHKYPQVLLNVKIRQRQDPLGSPQVQAAVEKAEKILGQDGRVIVRLSGTELVVRVMVEGPEDSMIEPLAENIAQSITSAFGTP